MAQFLTDFSEYTTGIQPGDWTERWETLDGTSIVTDDTAMVGDKKLRQTVVGNNYYVLSWGDVGSVADVEGLVRFIPGSDVDSICRVLLRGSGFTSTRTAYFGYLHVNSNFIGLQKYVNGVSTSLGTAAMTLAVDTAYLMRIRANGTDVKLKVWADGSSEPASWDIEVTDSSVTSGWAGVGQYGTSTQDIDWVSFATAGDTAEFPPVPSADPPSGEITITGSVLAVGTAPGSGALTATPGTPIPGTALSVSPASGEIVINGSTPVPIGASSAFPYTVQMRITGQTPTVFVPSIADLVVSLPPLSSLFEAKGLNASLQVTLPAIAFVGETSAPGWLAVTLPPVSVLLGGGSSLVVDLPMPEVLLTGAVGSIGSLHVEMPSLAFSAGAGSALSLDLPPLESLFTGTVGTAGSLHVSLPPFAALFAGTVENKGELVINLPGLQSLFTATQQNLGSLHVDLPPLAALFSGFAGEPASLQVTLPALEALFTAYEDLTGQLVIVLPALQALFEASQTGRFDTATPTQLDGVILCYRRPV